MKVYTTEEEQVERIKNFVKDYGLTVIITLIVVIGVSFGWRYWQNRQEAIREQASSTYEQVVITSMSGQTKEAAIRAEYVIQQYPTTPYAQLAALVLAQQAVTAGNLAEADSQLKWVIQQGGKSSIAQVAKIRDARVLSAEGKNQEALSLLAEPMPQAYFAAAESVKGDIYLAMNNKAQAKLAYQQAIRSSPRGDSMAPLVEMKLADLATLNSSTTAQIANK